MKYDKKQVLNIIVNAAKKYKMHLADRHFLIIYQDKKEIKATEIEFRNNHFLHMTGVETKLSAQQFFDRCMKSKLSIHDFEIDKEGKCQRKVRVLPYVPEMLYNNCMIGNFINTGIYIKADYFVGNVKNVLSVGFRNGKKADYPVTLYKEDIRKLSSPTCPVIAVFSKQYDERLYNKVIYLSKRICLDYILELKDIGNLIKIKQSIINIGGDII